MCSLVDEGIKVFIGPESSHNSEIVQSIARKLHIPNFLPFSYIDPPDNLNESEPVMVFNLFPDINLPAAIATFVRESDWKAYAVLYEDESGLFRLQDVLKSRKPSDMPLVLRKIREDKNYR